MSRANIFTVSVRTQACVLVYLHYVHDLFTTGMYIYGPYTLTYALLPCVSPIPPKYNMNLLSMYVQGYVCQYTFSMLALQ